jgi:predicted nucleic acid-binding protein
MSGTSERTVYSWDTCVFLALLLNEEDKPLDDIRAVAREVETGAADLLVSTIVVAEMLDIVDKPDLATQFEGFLRRPNVQLWNVDPRVARRTAALRADWRRQTAQKDGNVRTPDAIVITTAVMAGATVLHSFDDKVLRFHKNPLVGDLAITLPRLAGGQKVFLTEGVEPP